MAELLGVFALEVDGKPTAAFRERSTREAQHFSKQSWLRSNLKDHTSNGLPLGAPNAELTVKSANAEETEIFNQVASEARSSGETVLAYLVELHDRRL
jgi:hypothetical protein